MATSYSVSLHGGIVSQLACRRNIGFWSFCNFASARFIGYGRRSPVYVAKEHSMKARWCIPLVVVGIILALTWAAAAASPLPPGSAAEQMFMTGGG